MAIGRDGAALRQLRTLFDAGTLVGLTDGQLLERFATRPPEFSGAAFAALVERHGPMVLRVCRGVVADPHEAQDAFQATFLILVRKAPGLWVQDSLGPWLHQVAYRTACCARSDAARRRRHERRAAGMGAACLTDDATGFGDEWEPVLHEEIARLPERYRTPLVLCYLEGLTCEAAAQQLRWPVGTLKSRLARGRERLRVRLTRRGVSLSVGALATLVSQETAWASGPTSLVNSTVKTACLFAAGRAVTAGSVSIKVAALTQGVLRTMFVTRLKIATAAVLAVILVAGGMRTASPIDQPHVAGESGARDDGRVRENTGSIQGHWDVIAAANDGEELPRGSLGNLRVVISENLIIIMDGKKSGLEVAYKLDPNSNPKRVDLTDVGSILGLMRMSGKPTRTMKGIYRLNGDELKIVYDEGNTAGQYPTDFVSEAGKSPNDRLVTLRRRTD